MNGRERDRRVRTRGLLSGVVLLLCLALSACGGSGEATGPYHCPMHPDVVQQDPGDCPICGMRLVPVKAEEEAPTPAFTSIPLYECPMHPDFTSREPTDCPVCGMAMVQVGGGGTASENALDAEELEGYAPVRIPGSRRQLIGVRIETVGTKNMERSIRTVAVVEKDETRIHHIHSKVTGWVERLQVDYTGQPVEKGQALFDIYSPDLVATQEEFLLALRNRDRLAGSPIPEVVESAERLVNATQRRLRLWDVPEREIRKLEETREVQRTLTFYAPMSGFVVEKWVEHGMFVDPGKMLFTIADLSEVWVIADVYEYELSIVREGQAASLEVSSYPAERFQGRVEYVYPTVDRKTRTAKVRFLFPNPDRRLKPGMFATVNLIVELGERVVVPEEAVLDTGTREIVFVAAEDGWFLPREITSGVRAGGFREVLGGVHPGERIVTSGNFMIDSESRLKASINSSVSKGGSVPAGHEGH